MKRLTALCTAVALTLALAAPVAAAQKVKVFEDPFVVPPDGGVAIDLGNDLWTNPEYFGESWACRDKVIYYQIKGKESLTLWYPNSVAEEDMMPYGRAWPWTKGLYTNSGTDYFAANEAMTKKVVSGKYTWRSHIYDHVIANPEKWKEQVTGLYWGINVPGYGTVLHDSGRGRSMIVQTFDPTSGDIIDFQWMDLGFRGNSTYDYDALCDYFDAGPAVFLDD